MLKKLITKTNIERWGLLTYTNLPSQFSVNFDYKPSNSNQIKYGWKLSWPKSLSSSRIHFPKCQQYQIQGQSRRLLRNLTSQRGDKNFREIENNRIRCNCLAESLVNKINNVKSTNQMTGRLESKYIREIKKLDASRTWWAKDS